MKRAYQREASKGWYFGFKLHALRHIAQGVMNIVLMRANWDDREPALALNEDAAGDITIADLGYRSSDCTESLEEAKRLLIPQAYAPERKDPALRSGKV